MWGRQELCRVLCEKLEEKMKSTVVDGTIQHLFQGHIVNYINCIDVEYTSSRKEEILDLQLDVKGCKDIYESFDKYAPLSSQTHPLGGSFLRFRRYRRGWSLVKGVRSAPYPASKSSLVDANRYVEVELMDGDNKYQAEGHGLQDAKKGILFDDFPAVLLCQLKRFEYDFQQDMTVKVTLSPTLTLANGGCPPTTNHTR
jgi:ubiquitin carboxyl-terminal hydrolase 7